MTENRTNEDAAANFEALRPRLIRVAYRMLGSVHDAEDIVQDGFLRWMGTDRTSIREPEAFLRRTVTRLCLDQLKSARHRRETYLGPWLPEPVAEADETEDVTLPLLLALERLSPLERAVFVLHDAFGIEFAEIASILERDTAACRQLASRAREHVRQARPRFPVGKQRGLALAEAFFNASRSGDIAALGALFAEDVSIYADGGGKRPAATQPVFGLEAVLKLHQHLAAAFQGSRLQRLAFINGLPGFVSIEADGELQTTALEVADDKVVSIYVMRNPDKLNHLKS